MLGFKDNISLVGRGDYLGLVGVALALIAAERAAGFKEGVRRAAESVDSGSARERLRALVEFTNRKRNEVRA